ncbi:methylenetetrahydrofolate reductase [Helicobacter burdigaliensis]|uniref:methylenetetrahydrofolate reductase n=1 Tax=Helicobacter burdigaliensis TaxID=2315334 RepID=UPI000EF6F1CD|nr:methylenetetrahydrofolate reductase [Helicobacter burdigaliensis]
MNKIENFIQRLRSEKKCFTYEFSVPMSFSLEENFKLLEKSKILDKIDAFVCTDSPLAKLKHNSLLASLKLQSYFNIPSITTMTMRDKNTLALQSELIGMNSLDLRLILALTGDPLRHGNQIQARPVFEGNSQLLLKIIAQLNSKKDINDNDILGENKPIYAFSVLNAYANNKDNLYKKMYDKVKNGANAIFTQPVYDLQNAKELLGFMDSINKELQKKCILVLGFFPITTYKTALFLHNKLPGVFVPKDWLLELKEVQGLEDEKKVGLQKSKKLFEDLVKIHPKIHIMSANKLEVIEKILEELCYN